MPEPDIETRELSCELTEAELLQRGDAMAECEMAIDKLKGKRSKLSKKIGEKRKERFELAEVIECGTEPRDVRCAWIEDFAQNCFHLVRQDTGEAIDTRAMTAVDRQLAIGEPGQPEETIDLDDVPDDDEEFEDDDELGGEDEKPKPEPVKTRARGRGRQQQPTA